MSARKQKESEGPSITVKIPRARINGNGHTYPEEFINSDAARSLRERARQLPDSAASFVRFPSRTFKRSDGLQMIVRDLDYVRILLREVTQ